MTITYTYQWIHTPDFEIPGATGTSYTLVAGDLDTTVSCLVTATNGITTVTAEASNPQFIGSGTNGFPVSTANPVVSGGNTVGSTLSTTNGTWSNSPTSFTYQWFRDPSTTNEPIAGATNNTYTVISGQVGAVIYCQVTAINSNGNGVASSNSITITSGSALVPASIIAPVLTGGTTVGSTLSVTNGTWTNSPTSFTYTWVGLGGQTIAGATANTYVVPAGQAGASIYCTVGATNSNGSGTANSNAITIPSTQAPIPDQPPILGGGTTVGSSLTTNAGTWTGGTPTSYEYIWKRDGVTFTTTTSNSYNSVLADVGHSLTVVVNAINAAGSATSASSNAIVITPGQAPIPDAFNPPVLSGSSISGNTLTASTGTWTGGTPTGYGYLWLRDGVAIPGITQWGPVNTYVTSDAEAGHVIAFYVKAFNIFGEGVSVISNGIGVTLVTPANTTPPVITGPGITNPTGLNIIPSSTTVTATTGTWTMSPTGFLYHWIQDGTTIVQSGPNNTFTVTGSGHTFNVSVQAYNDAGSSNPAALSSNFVMIPA